MQGPVHTTVLDGRTITATWFDAPFRPWRSRVYGLCFTGEGRIVLVRPAASLGWQVPGGGVEDGESPEDALVRELREEITANVDAYRYLGCQRVDDLDDPGGSHSDFHLFYWCRVRLDPFQASEEIAERMLVGPGDFLNTMSLSDDPAAAIALERALLVDQAQNVR